MHTVYKEDMQDCVHRCLVTEILQWPFVNVFFSFPEEPEGQSVVKLRYVLLGFSTILTL